MKPILTYSEITGCVYIATKYKVLDDGTIDTQEKYDVTDQFDAMTEPLRAENAKLRKTLRRCYMSAATLCDLWDGPCRSTEKSYVMWPCPLSDTKKACVRKGLKRACKKLGIEVG